ncbi:GNAT family N-acetyltransferase [Niallia taxi]|uniref:GNAT family N-acetyltransferase n=1 Tax=Niallia taxi TaxID=2499688 RepID=UPI0021A94085|nr:N-acetyltransferase [Niallia taxi]MCT2345420.1 GNAT family N-acetyltransferase [Niallia taxi]
MNREITNSQKEIEAVAVLLMDGFAGKFQILNLPKREQHYLLHCLVEHIIKNHRQKLLIIRDKSIKGILFIKPKRWHLIEFLIILCKQLSCKSIFKTFVFFCALDHSKKDNEIHIDFITVSKAYQGVGIGTQLIELVKSSAINGQSVTLYVSKANIAARRLYERLGFQIKKEGKSIVGRHLHGINQWYLMEWKGSNNHEKEI